MAAFTALLTLELQAPLAIQKLRRATERLAVRQQHLAVKTAKCAGPAPRRNLPPLIVILS